MPTDTVRKKSDLHCHILPGIDDGSKSIESSLAMLKEELRQGTESIVFTPHFNLDKKPIDEFLAARDNAFKLLTENEEFKKMNIKVKQAAEVYFSVSLDTAELDSLCFGDSKYILIEFPFFFKPQGLTYMIDNVINRGYIPILAHVERYDYIRQDPTILYELVKKGCYAHINAAALLHSGASRSLSIKYIKWGLVHFLCSDCHSVDKRPPDLDAGYELVRKKLGEECCDRMINNSLCVFNGEKIDVHEIKKPKNVLGFWV